MIKDYEHKRESLLAMQGKIKDNDVEYTKLKDRYSKALEKIDELKALFFGFTKGDQNITTAQM